MIYKLVKVYVMNREFNSSNKILFLGGFNKEGDLIVLISDKHEALDKIPHTQQWHLKSNDALYFPTY